MKKEIELDGLALAAILKSPTVAEAVQQAAESVAANARSQGIRVGDRPGGLHQIDLPVTVKMSTTDRAHATVALAHPAGLAVQAKHGTLTKAAAAAGLDVRAK